MLLIVLFSPLLLAAWIYLAVSRRGVFASAEVVELPSEDNPQTWKTYQLAFATSAPWIDHPAAGWKSFFWRFLPGLFAVVRGRLSLVGLPPRTRSEILNLPEDWRSLYVAGKAGLISEITLFSPESTADAEAYLAEACYCATRGPRHDLNLFMQYFFGLLAGQPSYARVEGTPDKESTALRSAKE